MSLRCVRAMGVRQALAVFGNAIDNRVSLYLALYPGWEEPGYEANSSIYGDTKQAMGEGKSGPVETGLTRLVATALVY